MAHSPQSGKKSVDLAAPVVRVSRIRRDPPPPVKVVTAAEIKDRDAQSIVIGIVAVTLALIAILLGVTTAGWSPSQYTIHVEMNG